jgi:hypothetical protein
MKRYRVIVTPDAEAELKVYLSYLRNVMNKNHELRSLFRTPFYSFYKA